MRAEYPSDERENDSPPEERDPDQISNNDDGELDPPRLRQPPLPHPDLVEKLPKELSEVVKASVKFEAYDSQMVNDSAHVLVRYGILSLERFRTTDGQARKYLFEDIRKTEKLSFREISLNLKLNKHTPTRPKNIRKEHSIYGDRHTSRPISFQTRPFRSVGSFPS